MYTNALFKKMVSARGNTCAQLFVAVEGFVSGKAMKSKTEVYKVLEYNCREYRVPRMMVSDNAKEETLGDWKGVAKQNLLKQPMTKAWLAE
jgi:hypothetical protein